MNKEFKIGDSIIWHTGFYGGEQGSPNRDNWWPQDKFGKILKIKDDLCLLEFEDRSRQWAELKQIEKS